MLIWIVECTIDPPQCFSGKNVIQNNIMYSMYVRMFHRSINKNVKPYE